MKKIELNGEELMYVTENSVWIIREDTYQRMPKQEKQRSAMSEALVDGKWHLHEGVWEVPEEEGSKTFSLRVLPAGRPEGSYGLLSSPVVEKLSR